MFSFFQYLFGKEKPAWPAKQLIKTDESIKTVESIVDFDSMNKAQMLDYAKFRNIKVNASMKKAEILAAIKSAG